MIFSETFEIYKMMSKMFAKDITNKNMTACLSILMMCIFVLSACNVNNKRA